MAEELGKDQKKKAGLFKKKDDNKGREIEAHNLISGADVEGIRTALNEQHADLVIEGMLNPEARAKLERVVQRDFKNVTKNNKAVIDYVVRETIGTGVIEEILLDERITDIGYNGEHLIIETNDNKIIYDTGFELTDAYIIRLINKFAVANNKELTSKTPVLDGRFQNVRINAVHGDNTAPESGTTMSLRVVRPRLALTVDNFEGFAPMFMYDFFRAAAITKSNMVISGTTGTGKTELHKLISGFIPFEDRILLIEDTPETFMKEMFPDKDIYSWVTSETVSVTQLIKAGLRNHPVWIMVTETRGQEAYEMIQAVLSGHSIITSLHAVEARAIPSRFINMAKMGYELSEEALKDDIRRYFNFGIHIKKAKYHGRVIRYLQEVIAFHPDGDKTIFKQRFVDGVFSFETHDLPQDFIDTIEEFGVSLEWPEPFKASRPLDESILDFETIVPLDHMGRPDHAKIAEMGTTLDKLLGVKSEDDPSDTEEDLFEVSDKEKREDEKQATADETASLIESLKNDVAQNVGALEKDSERQAQGYTPKGLSAPLTVDLQSEMERIMGKVVEKKEQSAEEKAREAELEAARKARDAAEVRASDAERDAREREKIERIKQEASRRRYETLQKTAQATPKRPEPEKVVEKPLEQLLREKREKLLNSEL